MYFLAESLAQSAMVITMKMVANAAREAMAMRQCFTTPWMEHVLTSVTGGFFETSRGAVVVAGADLFVGIGNLFGTRGIKITATLVETAVVELAESVETEGDSVVEFGLGVSAKCDVEIRLLVAEAG